MLKISKRLKWIARIWSIPIIFIVLLIFIGNLWDIATNKSVDQYMVSNGTFIEYLPPILISLSTIGLILAWKWEYLGGILTIIFQLIMLIVLFFQTPLFKNFPRSLIPYIIFLIVITPGILFVLSSKKLKDE